MIYVHAPACATLVYHITAVYIGEDAPDEPDLQYIPDTHHITTTLPPGGDALAASLLLLEESLQSGAALAQFEVSLQSGAALVQ